MYSPNKFSVKEKDEIWAFVEAHPFAILISHGEDGLISTHIPILLYGEEDTRYLAGHIARGNPQRECIMAGREAMAIFHGPHAYISSSWYERPDVPTWNYQAVHLHGVLQEMRGEELRNEVDKLVSHFEKGRPGAVSMEGLPTKLVETNLRGIAGFRMEVQKVEATFKLSQNRPHDIDRITGELLRDDDTHNREMGELMRRYHGGDSGDDT